MTYTDSVAQVNGIRLRYLDYPSEGAVIVFLHGLTANAMSFAEIAPRLSPRYRVLVPDLRGRGLSDKPPTGYTMADHAADVLGLLDSLGIASAVFSGHSFGGMLALFIAAHHPERASRLVLLDAGVLNPGAVDLIRPSTDRIGKVWPSWADYIEKIKAAPYLDGAWEPGLEAYFRADVVDLPDGSVTTRMTTEALLGCTAAYLSIRWPDVMQQVKQPVLLINAPGPYGPPGTPAIQGPEQAAQTVSLLANCQSIEVGGNHVTMLFSEGAAAIATAIQHFVG